MNEMTDPMSSGSAGKFLKLSLPIFFVYALCLFFSGYFEIGFLSDDYLNFISANSSSLCQKFTSSIPYESNLHFRPLWFLSISFITIVNDLLGSSAGNFLLFRIDNLLCLCMLAFISSYLLYKITRRLFLSIMFLLMILLYPNILNDICWTVGKAGILCGIFMIASLYFTFSYIENKSAAKIFSAVFFFVLALLTKEPAVILPFIATLLVILAFGKAKLSEIKYLIIFELLALLIYTIYRVFFLTNVVSVTEAVNEHGISNIGGVILRAAVSLVLPYDYLSIQYSLFTFDIFFFIYLLLIIISAILLISNIVASGNSKRLILPGMIFLVTILPNMIAGYFRPQLTLIPFLIFYFSLFFVLSKIPYLPGKARYLFFAVMIFWVVQSYSVINEWRYAYEKSEFVTDQLVNADLDFNFNSKKRNIILGLPARYRQAYLIDNAFAQYNFKKYNDMEIHDEIYDFVHTGALDTGSLNSELSLKPFGKNEFELEATGSTQFFQPVSNDDVIKDMSVEIRLESKNQFGKFTKMKVKILPDSADVYYFSRNKLIKIN